MSANIFKSQEISRTEDYGEKKIIQTCTYNSISEWIAITHEGQGLELPVDELKELIRLANECLAVKGVNKI